MSVLFASSQAASTWYVNRPDQPVAVADQPVAVADQPVAVADK